MTPASGDARPRPDSTLYYGPFGGSWWPVVVSLAFAALLALIALDGERSVFRSIECTRPGNCVVLRGSDWVGPSSQVIAADELDHVEVQRSTGKNPRESLLLRASTGKSYELLRGPDATPLYERLKPFVEDPAQTRLSVHLEQDLADRLAPAGFALLGLVTGGYFSLVSWRRSRRYRIQILRGQDLLRVERLGLGARDVRETHLENVVGARVQRGRGRTARIVVETASGPELLVSPHFLGGGSGHETTCAELLTELAISTREDRPRR